MTKRKKRGSVGKPKKRKSPKPKHVYLISAARKISRWSPEHKQAIADASVGPDLVRCAICAKLLPKASPKKGARKMYAVDHIIPIVPVESFSPQIPIITGSQTWDSWLMNLFFGERQILCHPCHKVKTDKENNERRKKRPILP
jgi:hypothetical protein